MHNYRILGATASGGLALVHDPEGGDTILVTVLLPILLIPSLVLAWDAASFKKPSESELKKKLSAMQYEVTQKQGTEPPFRNKFFNHHAEGIYVDVVSGEPLFSSKDKFDSGTGWPSFTRPLVKANVEEKEDHELWEKRVEVRSKHAGSHLGHVFDDGPKPTGLRYCIDSAALRFVPKAKLKAEGYGEFEKDFR